jgi:hypothetical protein
MTQSPILFSSPMIRALLEGRKTQTRRIVKRPTDNFHASYTHLRTDVIAGSLWWWDGDHERAGRSAPYPYEPGQLLWVRESWNNEPIQWHGGASSLTFKADYDEPALNIASKHGIKWRPSIHMPRWASRITLEVTAVKVERLQDISEEDAKAEGADEAEIVWRNEYEGPAKTRKAGFRNIWFSIHGPASWDANPWVVAVSFLPHLQNIDQLIAARAA